MLRLRDLGPVTEIREITNGQVMHRLREQRKVPRFLSEGSIPLTKKTRRLRLLIMQVELVIVSFIIKIF